MFRWLAARNNLVHRGNSCKQHLGKVIDNFDSTNAVESNEIRTDNTTSGNGNHSKIMTIIMIKARRSRFFLRYQRFQNPKNYLSSSWSFHKVLKFLSNTRTKFSQLFLWHLMNRAINSSINFHRRNFVTGELNCNKHLQTKALLGLWETSMMKLLRESKKSSLIGDRDSPKYSSEERNR